MPTKPVGMGEVRILRCGIFQCRWLVVFFSRLGRFLLHAMQCRQEHRRAESLFPSERGLLVMRYSWGIDQRPTVDRMRYVTITPRLVQPIWRLGLRPPAATRMIYSMHNAHFNKLRTVIFGTACLYGMPMAWAKMDAGAVSAQTSLSVPPPVPASISWIGAVLLGLMWLVIAAIVQRAVGPALYAPKPPAKRKICPLCINPVLRGNFHGIRFIRRYCLISEVNMQEAGLLMPSCRPDQRVDIAAMISRARRPADF